MDVIARGLPVVGTAPTFARPTDISPQRTRRVLKVVMQSMPGHRLANTLPSPAVTLEQRYSSLDRSVRRRAVRWGAEPGSGVAVWSRDRPSRQSWHGLRKRFRKRRG